MNLAHLLIIFSWPVKQKNIGVTHPDYCPHCDNETWLTLMKERRWLKIYFIPVLPLSRKSYYLYCDICHVSIEIERENVSIFKDMHELTRAYSEGRLSISIYEREISELLDEYNEIWEQEHHELDGISQDNTAKRFDIDNPGRRVCNNCDVPLLPEDTYCPHCGNATDLVDTQ